MPNELPSSSIANAAAPASAGGPRARGASPSSDRWHLRLIIALPTILVLFTLTFGLVSYLSFSNHRDKLTAASVAPIVGDMLQTHMIAMIVLSAAAAVTGVVLAYSILRPIRALIETTRQVALGRLDLYTPDVPAAPELDHLSRSFNAMIDDLNRSIAERNRCLMEGIPNGVLTTDMDGRVSAVNQAAGQILGMPAEELLGRRVSELAGSDTGAARGLAEYLLRLLDAGTTVAGHEVTLQNSEGGPSILVSASFLRDSARMPFGVMFNLRDSAKVRDLSAHISRTDQLAMLGTFTLGLAHELRNPLGAIKGLSQLLGMEKGLPAGTKGYLDRMTREVDRVDDFVRQLLDMSQQPPDCPMPTDLSELLIQAAELARLGIPAEKLRQISVMRDMEMVPPLEIQADRLRQALVKILHNAYEWTPPGGCITIRTRRGSSVAPGAGMHSEVRIHNSGSFIPKASLQRIFEPFFTTRDCATGLGLTIAHQIIMQNGGTIEAESGHENAGAGVTFVLRFESPRAVALPAAPSPSGRHAVAPALAEAYRERGAA